MEDGRIELPLHACKAHVLPLSLIPLGAEGETRTHVPFGAAYKAAAIATMRLQQNPHKVALLR